ncbi:MAG: hypothetical protein ACTSRG_17360 [Candidatus Helarchaeota archaeon]
MEEIDKGEFILWELNNHINFLLKTHGIIKKYTLIPKNDKYLIVWARKKEKWSTNEYFEEKRKSEYSKKGKFNLYRDSKKYLLKLGDVEFILPHGLPKESPLRAIKTEKPLKFKIFRQKKLFDT